MIADFSAPPARQPSSDGLPGEGGTPAAVGMDGPANDNSDLPLTAHVRQLADPIELATVVTALVALALFVAPFVLGR